MKYKYLLIFLCFLSLNASAQTWLWGRQGTNVSCQAWGAAADNNGNVYYGSGFNDTMSFGTTHLSTICKWEAYLLKYDANGNLLWLERSYGLTSNCRTEINNISLDTADNIFVVGQFNGTVIFGKDTLKSISTTGDLFLVKYDANGNELWAIQSKSQSVTDMSFGNGVTTDVSGNVYITSGFTDTIKMGGTLLENKGQNTYIAKYTANGNLVWVNQSNLGNSNSRNSGLFLTADGFGNLYIYGLFYDSVSFGAITLTSKSQTNDAFLLKYDTNGTLIWGRESNSPSIQSFATPFGMTVDTYGNIYITGEFSDTTSFGSVMLINKNVHTNTVFLTKYNPSGSIVWAKQSGYANNGYFGWTGYTLTRDLNNNIYYSAGGAPKAADTVVFLSDTLSIANPTDPLMIMKLDTGANVKCYSVIRTGGSVSPGIGCSPNGKYVYLSSNLIDTITFNKDFLKPGNATGLPFVARWQPCNSCNTAPKIVSTPNICKGKVDTLLASGGTSFLWSNGDTTSSIIVSPANTITYTVTVSNKSCSAKDSVTVNVTPYPVPVISQVQSVCIGNSVTITASGGGTYLWNNGSTNASINVTPSSTGGYTVTVSNGKCSVKDSTSVFVNPLPSVTACCDSVIGYGQNVQLTSSGGSSYAWTPSSGLSCNTCPNPVASPGQTTTYTLTIKSDSGCSSTTTITIDVTCGTIFIPEAFSPNGDGHNDVLYVRGDCIKTMDFIVFDRWGNKVFESTSLNYGWDGTYKNEPMNAGSYAYYLNATLYNGNTYTKKGNVTLVR